MKNQKNDINGTENNSTKTSFPKGIMCDGYCYECCHMVRSTYLGSTWWCTWHDKAVSQNDWKACCDK